MRLPGEGAGNETPWGGLGTRLPIQGGLGMRLKALKMRRGNLTFHFSFIIDYYSGIVCGRECGLIPTITSQTQTITS